jgi:probable F420-dependent oxidoreductase
VKFGLNFLPVYPGAMAETATHAEKVGFESLWIGEHVLVPFGDRPEADRLNWKPDSRFLQPWVTLSHLAAVTERVRLGTNVLVAPLHHPVHLAREVATLDVLSNGRVSVGLGVGMIRGEYDAVNEEYSNRGRRLDEMIQVLDSLFTEERPEFHGEYYDFPASGFEPKPVQKPRPPILIGGGSKAAFRRAIEVGDGWFGGSQSPDHAAQLVADLRERREAIGKPPLEITVLTGWSAGYDAHLTRAYEAAGVDRIVVTPWTSSRAAIEGIEKFALDAGI